MMNSPNSRAVRSPSLDECAQITPLDSESEVCPKKPTHPFPSWCWLQEGRYQGRFKAPSGAVLGSPAIPECPPSPLPPGVAIPYQIALNLEEGY